MKQEKEISNTEVVNLASDCVRKYIDEMGWKLIQDVTIDVIGIYEYVIYPNYGISLITEYDLGEHGGQKILGKMISSEKTILIDKSINQQSHDPRFTFTLGHEIGHAVSHMAQNAYFRCAENTIYSTGQNLQEFQANLFAENLIMPAALVEYRYNYYYDTNRPFRYVGAGNYCIGNKGVHINSMAHLGWRLAIPLTRYFSNISKESLAYRMLKIGIIKNETEELMSEGMKAGFCGSKINAHTSRYVSQILHI